LVLEVLNDQGNPQDTQPLPPKGFNLEGGVQPKAPLRKKTSTNRDDFFMEFVPSNLLPLFDTSVLKSQKRTFYFKVAERLAPSVWV